MSEWVKRWNYEIAAKASAPSIWRLKSGGYLVRVRAGGQTKTRSLPDAKLQDAQRVQRELRQAMLAPTTSLPRWVDYAKSVFERKITDGSLASAKTQERWETEITACARVTFADGATLGLLPVDLVSRARVVEMRDQLAERVATKTLSPTTANSTLRTFRQICQRAARDFDLRDPTDVADYFFTLRTHRTYTRENPNALTPKQATTFLAKCRELFPQHYAMVVLGMVTGLRPSSLRALRRSGPEADVDWERGTILVRRSHAMGEETMDATKTGVDQELALPPEVVAILREHVQALESPPRHPRFHTPPRWWRPPMASSELLFPGRDGSFRARSALDKVFDEISEAAGLPSPVTPRAMRRTFKDLARRSGMDAVVSKAVSGHQTEEMHEHYQTVAEDEMRAALAQVAGMLDPSKV